MRNINKFILMYILNALFGFNTYGQSVSEKEEFIRSFYDEYFKVFLNSNETKKLKEVECKYISRKLRREIEHQNLDYNKYINAQDCDSSSYQSLKIYQIDSNNFEVRYGTVFITKINIQLIEKKGKFKISNVS